MLFFPKTITKIRKFQEKQIFSSVMPQFEVTLLHMLCSRQKQLIDWWAGAGADGWECFDDPHHRDYYVIGYIENLMSLMALM